MTSSPPIAASATPHLSDQALKWLSTLLLPFVLLYLGHRFASENNERTAQAKFVEIAIQILREAPNEDRKDLRLWAVKVVDRYAGVPLSQKAAADLVQRLPLTERRFSDPAFTAPELDSTVKEPPASVASEPSRPKTLSEVRRAEAEWNCKYRAAELGYFYWHRMCASGAK
jgi:hypothetical protein